MKIDFDPVYMQQSVTFGRHTDKHHIEIK